MADFDFQYHQRDRFWIRDDHKGNRLFVVNNKDNSPEWPKWEVQKYDPDCSSCWLNIPHSTQYHERKVT